MHEYQTQSLLSALLKPEALNKAELYKVWLGLNRAFKSSNSFNLALFSDLTNHVNLIKKGDSYQYDSLKIIEFENQLNLGLTKLI
jgi:hypothetical protein